VVVGRKGHPVVLEERGMLTRSGYIYVRALERTLMAQSPVGEEVSGIFGFWPEFIYPVVTSPLLL
jgi:hypothetical protein